MECLRGRPQSILQSGRGDCRGPLFQPGSRYGRVGSPDQISEGRHQGTRTKQLDLSPGSARNYRHGRNGIPTRQVGTRRRYFRTGRNSRWLLPGPRRDQHETGMVHRHDRTGANRHAHCTIGRRWKPHRRGNLAGGSHQDSIQSTARIVCGRDRCTLPNHYRGVSRFKECHAGGVQSGTGSLHRGCSGLHRETRSGIGSDGRDRNRGGAKLKLNTSTSSKQTHSTVQYSAVHVRFNLPWRCIDQKQARQHAFFLCEIPLPSRCAILLQQKIVVLLRTVRVVSFVAFVPRTYCAS
mmetsp:Transcript_21725/g.45716  ORF Transcript_21725/g.45716 Transcript_21725/m.45716 type:complete len:294 (-) Transcript_21725:154-1035(-)